MIARKPADDCERLQHNPEWPDRDTIGFMPLFGPGVRKMNKVTTRLSFCPSSTTHHSLAREAVRLSSGSVHRA